MNKITSRAESHYLVPTERESKGRGNSKVKGAKITIFPSFFILECISVHVHFILRVSWIVSGQEIPP